MIHLIGLRIDLVFLCSAVLLVACGTAADTPSSTPTGDPSITPGVSPTTTPFASPVALIIEAGPTQDSTPEPSLQIPYTKDNPLTDSPAILGILDALRQRQETWFSRPGWYQKTVCNDSIAGSNDWMACLHFLVHVLDETRSCREQMVYFIVDGQPMPFQIMLENGATAGFNVPAGTFGFDGVRPTDPTIQCSLESLESVKVWGESLLTDERAWFDAFENDLNTGGGSQDEGSGATAGRIIAWKEQMGEQDFFVLAYEIHAFRDPQPVLVDPDTGQNLLVEHSTRLKWFDLNTGLPLSEQEILYLQNGQMGDDEWIGNIQYTYYDVLPAELSQVYTDAANRVLAELGR